MSNTKNPILQGISNWFVRHFSDPEALALFFTLFFVFLLIEFFGKYLLPVVISVVLAYLFASPVRWLERWRFPHWAAVTIVYLFFLGIFLLALFGLLPLMWKQLASMVHEFPKAITKGQAWMTEYMHRYPKLFPTDPIANLAGYLHQQSARIGQFILSFSLASIPGIIEAILYLVLVPLLVFFFLKDGGSISNWLSRFLPERQGLIRIVWHEMNQKIGAYVRGRVIEIIIVSIVAVIAFVLLGLQYAFLLGVLLGLSVIVPYIGAIVVTIPIAIVGLMQWGLSAHFAYLMIVYAIIITLDGNLLVPLLFSEAMDLHPIVIILSVLVFGGIWGFWGIFFAIPLATLVKTVLNAWPKARISQNETE
ncbi:AI-2E family transporter [Coxiella burnetii]|uniref:AI-2E family transporter n=1 Tax=Coxiella burnetii TaxID=777 RepID=UPI0000ED027F|nr:AI-2E family transporter [Coxiella burnetii]ACJ20758.1 riboflavin transporter [Coxiella burnetii CbuK_Q154]EAX32170.1 AI-2E family transporter [Coxiella burnetii 'MSU Goat Q177']UYK70283.1 AI-2E family transporter [Coxiella burnetii]